ncbi:MAG: hypothetical protein R3202_09630 [Candidatus Competibacterales bacterium]|nr:hypothetical protein [Candidatus Competibacterales bacterium]
MRFLICLSCLLLAGCQQLYPYAETSPHYGVPEQSVLVLNQPLRVAPGRLSVYLQDGQAYTSAPDRYQPYCKFELRHKRATMQRVTPDRFRVRRATRHWTASAPLPARPVAVGLPLIDEDGPSFLVYSSFFHLHSERQPEVLKMTCEYWGDPATGRFLSIAQIRRTLGEIFTLELNGPGVML